MSVVKPIPAPLPGERVVGLSPEDANAAATDWLRRPNLFAGRALTAPTLEGRQRWQAGRVTQRGQAFSAGVVRGLEVALLMEDRPGSPPGTPPWPRLLIEPGHALATSGEDVLLARRTECLFMDLPVVAPAAWAEAPPAPPIEEDPTPPPPQTELVITRTLLPRGLHGSLAGLLATAGARMPRVGVLLLQPATVEVSGFDPTDPCDRCPCGDGAGTDKAAYEDWRISDALRVAWYPWPQEWEPLPTSVERARNDLAHRIFAAESQLLPGEPLPWEMWGVPIALMVFDDAWQPLFSDRAAVVRKGGRAREARLQPDLRPLVLPDTPKVLANSRLPGLWQARIEQFAEQVAEMGDPTPAPEVLANAFLTLPPCGLLPRSALDFATMRSRFFPPLTTLDAVPIPIEQLDVALREAAPLAPISMSASERVRVLVPVTQASWERRLLHTEIIDPEFQRTLDRFLLTRARELGARQGVRNEIGLLAQALTGQVQTVPGFNDDALAVEAETLSPWGPPPAGGGHRSTLRAGIHQHFFDGATETLTPQTGDNLYVWVHLDPDHPPRTLMLQWGDGKTWEHRAYWGEDLIPWGQPGPAHYHAGDLPEAGRWVQLEVPAEKLNLVKQPITGMAFTLYDGNAAFGMAGTRNPNTFTKWFCNLLPAGAQRLGDETWDMLSHNDLWAPFDTGRAVIPAIQVKLPPGNGGHQIRTPDTPLPTGSIPIVYTTTRLVKAAAQLAVVPTDTLTTWVYVDPLDPPRHILLVWMAGVGAERGNIIRGAYWGPPQLDGISTDLYVHMGTIPAGRWVRLEAPAQKLRLFSGGQSTLNIQVVYFALMPRGNVLFGASGKLNAAGAEQLWFAGDPPPSDPFIKGDSGDRDANWLTVPRATVAAPFTTEVDLRVGKVRAGLDLHADPALSALSGAERSQLVRRGLGKFVEYLAARIDRADDLTDYGFAKMQADIYRVRQLMMSASDATKLAVSPVLASIARGDSAVSAQAQIGEYLRQMKAASAPAVVAKAGAFETSTFRAAMSGAAAGATASVSAGSGTQANLSVSQAVQNRTAIKAVRTAASAQVVLATPVFGAASIRTTAIAKRLADPPSLEARNYALATRHEAVSSLVQLLNEISTSDGDSGGSSGLFADVLVYGLVLKNAAGADVRDPFLVAHEDQAGPSNPDAPGTGGAAAWRVRARRLVDFRTHPDLLGELLKLPEVGMPDEAALFSQVSDLSDNTIALLRQFEGRVKLYRDALARSEEALDELRADYNRTLLRLNATNERLAEARHDVGVARALMAEEQARIDAINARRTAVLANEVRFLAYMRPREADRVLAAPLRVVDPALAEAPVPACLRDHHDVPDELDDILRVVREAPAAWFMRVPALLDRLDRSDLLLRALRGAQQRTAMLAQRTPVAQPVAGRIGAAITQVLARQAPLMAARLQAVSALNLQALAIASWQGLRTQAQEVVSLGDLIDGEHGKGDVARRAADEFNRIGGVCTCLHAEFSGVLPSIRLDWAEVLSEFDDAPNLRNLGSLARWSEIDSVDRRQMQAYVDYLFAQVEPRQPQAEALVNDLVRMCLLLASHAPVGRIIAGRLPRPVTGLRPGQRIPLVALEPARLRVGMQAVIYRNNDVVARAAVEDVGGGEVAARVVHLAAGVQDLGLDVRVHFDHATVVSAAPARTGGIFKR